MFTSKKRSPGLALSDHMVKYCELVSSDDSYELGRFGEMELPHGTISGGVVRDAPKLAEMLKAFVKKENIRQAHVSLPEMSSPSKEIVKEYEMLFKKAGIRALSFESEATSIARAFCSYANRKLSMIVDFGETRTIILFVENHVVLARALLPIGGYIITNAIERREQISFSDAKKLKNKNGLRSAYSKKQTLTDVITVTAVLADMINSEYIRWHLVVKEKKLSYPNIKNIILSGSNASLPSIAEYLTTALKIPVMLGNPWEGIFNEKKYIPPMYHNDALGFASVIGVARKGIEEI